LAQDFSAAKKTHGMAEWQRELQQVGTSGLVIFGVVQMPPLQIDVLRYLVLFGQRYEFGTKVHTYL